MYIDKVIWEPDYTIEELRITLNQILAQDFDAEVKKTLHDAVWAANTKIRPLGFELTYTFDENKASVHINKHVINANKNQNSEGRY